MPRFLVLNKKPDELPTLSKLRPICIQGVIIKLLEGIIFPELQNLANRNNITCKF